MYFFLGNARGGAGVFVSVMSSAYPVRFAVADLSCVERPACTAENHLEEGIVRRLMFPVHFRALVLELLHCKECLFVNNGWVCGFCVVFLTFPSVLDLMGGKRIRGKGLLPEGVPDISFVGQNIGY